MINNEDFTYLNEKYGRLIKKAAYDIKGDKSKSPEDYESELWAIIIDYLPHFMRKCSVNSVREFCEHEEYGKYVKQWIWTKKLNFITKNSYVKYAFPSDTGDSFGDLVNELNPDKSKDIDRVSYDDYTELHLSELRDSVDIVDNILYAIAAGHNTVKSNGALNISRIAKFLNISPEQVNSNLPVIRERFKYAIKD